MKETSKFFIIKHISHITKDLTYRYLYKDMINEE